MTGSRATKKRETYTALSTGGNSVRGMKADPEKTSHHG